MKNVTIYDTDCEKIRKIQEEKNTSVAEVVQALFDAIENEGIDIRDYL